MGPSNAKCPDIIQQRVQELSVSSTFGAGDASEVGISGSCWSHLLALGFFLGCSSSPPATLSLLWALPACERPLGAVKSGACWEEAVLMAREMAGGRLGAGTGGVLCGEGGRLSGADCG